MYKESWKLYRYALAQVASLTGATLPQEYDDDKYHDLETKSGKRIDVKACRARIINGQRAARYSLNFDRNGKAIKNRIDYLVCLCYDEELRAINCLVIPAAELPDWETSIGVGLSPHTVKRSNRWYQFLTTLDELKNKLK
jgi:hypothetical protein